MRPIRSALFAAATLAATQLPASAQATPATASMLVSATVLSVCVVVAAPLAFGNYTLTQTDASSALTVTCSNGTAYSIGMDAGAGSGATTTNRLMTGPGGATLGYALYSNAGRTTRWGNTVGTDTLGGTGTGLPQVVQVYGRIPGSQSPAAGVYADTVTVTVTY